MSLTTWEIIRRAFGKGNARRTDRRPTMKLVKKPDQTTVDKSATRDELKLVCQRIADMDALWRTSALPEDRTEKRAA